MKVVRSKTPHSSPAPSSKHVDPTVSVSSSIDTDEGIQGAASSFLETMHLKEPLEATQVSSPSPLQSLAPPLHLSKGKRSHPKACRHIEICSTPKAPTVQPIISVSSQKDTEVQKETSISSPTSQHGEDDMDLTQVHTESVPLVHDHRTYLHAESTHIDEGPTRSQADLEVCTSVPHDSPVQHYTKEKGP